MDLKKLAEAANPDVLGQFLVELPDAQHTHQGREDEYKGHRIVIETHYEITVDGRPVPTHLTVDNDGNVHCHDLPAYEFVSAVDMVRVLIDTYPDEFPDAGTRGNGDDHQPHGDVRTPQES